MRRRNFIKNGIITSGLAAFARPALAQTPEPVRQVLPSASAAKTVKSAVKSFVSGRADGRFEQTAGFLHAYLKNLRPKLAFDPALKADDFPVWRKDVREKLAELLCLPDNIRQPPPQKVWSEPRDGYRLEKWEIYPEPFSVVPFLVLIPNGVSQQSTAPGVMCFPGSSSSKESLAGEPEIDTGMPATNKHWESNRQALFFVKKGFVSVAVDNPATNETDSTLRSRSDLCEAGLWMGRNYLGLSVFQKSCILKWLVQIPFVDSRRIAASGHSLGSNPADILGVLYPDLVKAVIHNDYVCNWQEQKIAMNLLPSPLWHVVPGLFQWFDHTDLEASLAPTPLLFTEGGRLNQINKIKQAYRLIKADDKIKVFHYKKYETPELRPFENKPMPEGISLQEYFQYANVDPSMHRFRGERAVPWLAELFGI